MKGGGKSIISVASFAFLAWSLESPFAVESFTLHHGEHHCSRTTAPVSSSCLLMAKSGGKTYGGGRSSSNRATNDRSKRQERVGHVVRTELAQIVTGGKSLRRDDDPIENELRRRINVVHADVSPDLRQARVTVSIMSKAGRGKEERMDDTVAKRRAYAWLIRETKSIRHELAQRMKHMKASPDLTFVQVDVGAAVDVMQLIEKVSSGYKRDDVKDTALEEEYGLDDDDDDDDGWEDEDDDDDGWEDDDDDDDTTAKGK